MESAAPTDCFCASFDALRHIIGTERHLQFKLSARNVSSSSARADHFQEFVGRRRVHRVIARDESPVVAIACEQIEIARLYLLSHMALTISAIY